MEDQQSSKCVPSKLEHIWEAYLQAEKCSYERSALLDVFLANLLSQIKDGIPAENVLSFCLVEGVASFVASDLLLDVHQICSQPPLGDDLAPLRKHFFRGPGWRSLAALHCLGVENICCGRELAMMLMSLYPLCVDDTNTTQLATDNPYLHVKEEKSIDETVGKLRPSLRKISQGFSGPTTVIEFNRSHSNTSTTKSRRRRSTIGCGSEEKATSESEPVGDDTAKSGLLKIRLNPMDFDYFTSVVRSDDDSRLASVNYTPKKKSRSSRKKTAVDFRTDTVEDVVKMELRGFEFFRMLVGLLQDLCSSEQCVTSNNSQPISIQAINFVLQSVHSLQFHKAECREFGEADIARLQASLARLLLISLEKIQYNETATTIFNQRGMLPAMIRILEDQVRNMPKLPEEIEMTSICEDPNGRGSKIHEFIYGFMCGIIGFIYHLLQRCSVDKIGDFLELLRSFTDSLGGRLFENTVLVLLSLPQVDQHLRLSRSKKLFDFIGQLIISLKRVRSELAHSSECKNKRHKTCGASGLEVHHQDLFGNIYVPQVVGPNASDACSISSLFMMLVRLLKVQNPDVGSRLLKVMTSCGTCCCFPARSVIKATVDILKRSPQKIRTLVFTMLERTIYVDLSAICKPRKTVFCNVCSSYSICCDDTTADSSAKENLALVNESMVNETPSLNPQNPWICFGLFVELLESPDAKVRHAITSHLLKIAPRCSVAVRYQLIFTVFYPTFLGAKSQPDTEDELSHFTILSCLSVFSSLLSNSLFATKFIAENGLQHILDLSVIPSLSKLCCSILEITAVVEIQKLENTTPFEIRNLPSISMLQEALTASTEKFFHEFEEKVANSGESPSENPPDLASVRSYTRSISESQKKADRSYSRNISVVSNDAYVDCPSCIVAEDFSITDMLKLEGSGSVEESYLLTLLDVCVFWRSCANLAVSSPQYRCYFSQEPISARALALLKLITTFIASGKTFTVGFCRELENHLYFKLMEATLITNLVAPPSPENLDDPSSNTVDVIRRRLSTIESTSNIRSLCDVLCACAVVKTSTDQVLPPLVLASADLSEPEADDDYQRCSSPEDTYVTADEGYEADVEVLPVSLPGVASSFNVESRLGRASNIVYPELCSLTIDLLILSHDRFYAAKTEDTAHLATLVQCLQRLVGLCRENAYNCITLANNNVISKLLQGFHSTVSNKEEEFNEVQRVVLDLVLLLARHRITSQDLALYLSLFKSECPSLDSLLNPLLMLVTSSKPQPHHIQCFPLPHTARKKDVVDCFEALRMAGADTCWARCALVLPTSSDVSWHVWQGGFSLSMWLRVESDSTYEESKSNESPSRPDVTHLHLFSTGYETLMLEVWLDSSADTLIVKLTRTDSNQCETIAETRVPNILLPGQWQYLAMNVHDYIDARKNIVEVVLIVDGWHEVRVALSFYGLLVRKPRATFLLLGHISPAGPCHIGAFYLGNLMLFRKPIFTKERALCMVGLGPNYTCLAECVSDKQNPNFTNVFGPDTLNGNVDWENILDGKKAIINPLQEELLMIYSPQNCHVYNWYPKIVASQSYLLFPREPSYSVQSLDHRASQQLPLSISPILMGDLNPQQYQGLVAAAIKLGGTPVFLFLFARVVELRPDQEVQARALYFLLKLVQTDSELFSQFVTQDCSRLLLLVLSSQHCIAGHHILKAILDACCNKPVLQFHPGPRKFQVVNQSDAIIVNSFLLTTVVGSWRDWERDVLGTLFNVLHVLLRDDHPYRDFNMSQLYRVEMVEALLLFCKECFLYEESPQLPATLCLSLAELVRSLMGAPPKVAHIQAVVKCLLLLHRASATYVTHVRSSFYYILAQSPPVNTNQDERANKQKKTSVSNLPKTKLSASKRERGSVNKVPDPQALKESLNTQVAVVNVVLPSCDGGENKENDSSKTSSLTISESSQDTNKIDVKPRKASEPSSNEPAQNLVMEGLLMILRDTLLVCPDSMARQVLNHVVTIEVLLILANHSDAHVRTAVVKTLSAHLLRCNEEEVAKFLKMKGFHQLANQLSIYPPSHELAEACLGLVTRFQVSLDKMLDMWPTIELAPFQLLSFPPILSLLPMSAQNPPLAQAINQTIREAFTKVPQAVRPLLEAGLVEVLLKTVVMVAHQDAAQDTLMGELRMTLVLIGESALLAPTDHLHFTQVLSTMLLQLSFLEQNERLSCGQSAHCVAMLRSTSCSVFEGTIQAVQDKILTLQSPQLKGGRSRLRSTLQLATNYRDTTSLSCNTNPVVQQKELSRKDMSERFQTVMVKAVDFVINSEQCVVEFSLVRRLLAALLRALGSVLERRATQRSPWTEVMWSAQKTLRTETAALLVWMLAPTTPSKVRLFAVAALRGEPKLKELMAAMLDTRSQKLTAFLWDLAFTPVSSVPSPDLRSCQDLVEQLQAWGLIAPLFESEMWQDEVQLLCNDMQRERQQWAGRQKDAVKRSVYKYEDLVRSVSESAATTSRTAVGLQNAERKAFMEHIKASYSENVEIRLKWHKIIQQMIHERGVWHFPQTYPRCWQLDPTEGPGRVRKRLQRCHLELDAKYFMEKHHDALRAKKPLDPLSFLFERDNNHSSTSSLLIERLHTNEKIIHMCTARIVTPACELNGELLVGESCLYFVADKFVLDTRLEEFTADSLEVSSMVWHFADVREIHKRRFQLEERALEIFLLNGRTYLVAFQTPKDRDNFLIALGDCTLPNRTEADHLDDYKQLWREGLITNFEYLMLLNKMSGRSYNDLMQYPVFPFVLSNYTDDTLDLTDPRVFRNFKKPMAVQDKQNEQHYIKNYNYLQQEYLEGNQLISLHQEPYHYGSHYSNSGTVLHFLVRLPPFTRMFLTYQDRSFDLPDRTFHSLHTTWRLSSSESTTDVKEMIPEFFYLPEFLQNAEGFNFGVRQNGELVDDVQLPSWCRGNFRTFVLVHRQALEAAYVREHLPHWLDLVFGWKQTGKAAVDAINVFHPATYSGFDVETIKDPVVQSAWKTMTRTYGQTPRQLLRVPHPMVIQALASFSPTTLVPEVIPDVKGLVWGNYVGSPADPEPTILWKHKYRSPIASFVTLATNEVFGVPAHTTLLVSYSKDKDLKAAQVTWGHADNAIRAKIKSYQAPWPIVKAPALDPVSVCASTPESNQLWLGLVSGRIMVYRYRLEATKPSLELKSDPTNLLGHTGSVTSICLSLSFSVAVSGSLDDTAIIWDMNKLVYVRTITMPTAVTLVCISETLGDIAMVCTTALHYHTVNAAPIGSVNAKEPITAICFSNVPEGISVNVIACGLASGNIMLWSTWDLTPVRELCTAILNRPIASITYSSDGQHLYAASVDGTIVIWHRASSRVVNKPAMFLNL